MTGHVLDIESTDRTPSGSQSSYGTVTLLAGTLGVLLGLVAGPGVCRIAGPHAAQDPSSPLWPELYAAATQQFELVDRAAPSGAVVYVGDSQTAWISLADLTRCSPTPVLNRGIAGDTTAGVLERVRGSFPPEAAVCVVLVGFNDIHRGDSPERAAERVEHICRTLVENAGVRTIVLESVPTGRADVRPRVDAFNALLATIPRRIPGVAFLDLAGRIWEHGGSAGALWVDGVHFSAVGVEARLEIEAAFLREVRPDLDLRLTCGSVGAEIP